MAKKVRRTARQVPVLETPREGLLDMGQAIALLKTTRPTFYRWLRAGKLKSLKVGRQWRFQREDIEHFLKGEEPRIELPVAISPLVEGLREQCVKAGGSQGLPAGADVAAAAELMILLAHRVGASDIHLEPVLKQPGGTRSAQLRLRGDGVLRVVAETDARLLPALVQRWKTLAACNVQEREHPQDGHVALEIKGAGDEQRVDLSVCFLPTVLGEALTARIIPSNAAIPPLDRMDFSPGDKARLTHALKLPHGLVVFSGPAGSGKTTVMLACLGQVANPESKVFSIEDPVAVRLPGIQQIRVRPDQGLDFTGAIKAVMRCDPDIIAVGEVTDSQTLKLTLDAAMTGHLVLTQVHANESVRVLRQFMDLGGDHFLVCEVTKLIVGQRLVRQLCPECSLEEDLPPELLAKAQELGRSGGLAWESLPAPIHFREPAGCPKCRGGFRGRTLIAETLEVTPALGAALRNGATEDELRALAIRQGMTTIVADGIRKAASGVTALREALSVCGYA